MSRKTNHDASDTRAKRFWHVLPIAVCLISFCLYLPSLGSGFIHDDQYQIVKNPQIKSWDYLARLLTTDVWSQKGSEHIGHYYRPLFSVWMLLVCTLGGLRPWFWHLSSILLHGIASYLVFRLCKVFLKSVFAASLAALLFAAHPIHVDAVSWVSASNELLFTIFVLAALLSLVKGACEQRPSWIALSLGFYGAALLSKETAVAALPVFPFVWWLVQKDDESKRRIPGKWSPFRVGAFYLVPTALYLIVRALVLGGTGVEAGKHSWVELLYSGPGLLVFYLQKLVWPVRLAGFYVNPLTSSPTLSVCFTSASLVLGGGLVIWLSRRFSYLIALGAALIFCLLLPLLAGVRVYDQGNMTHDRYLYLPSVGLCLLLGLAIDKASKSRGTPLAVVSTCAAVLILFGILTVRQQKFYQDDKVFYQRALAVDPTNSLVMGYLGDSYLEDSNNEQAMEWFQRAVGTSPNDPNIRFFLARGLMKTQQYAAAQPYLQDLAYGNQQMPKRQKSAILLSLANAQLQLNEIDVAKKTLWDLQNFNPSFPGLHRTLGIALQRDGKIQEAQKEYALEFQTSGDREAGKQALALARQLSSRGEAYEH